MVLVYKGEDGKMYVDFVMSVRFDAQEWVDLVRRGNDKLFDKLLNGTERV